MNYRVVPTENERLIANMRARAEQCRRLAAALTDKRAAAVLLKMAEEVETDIEQLAKAAGQEPNPMPPVTES